MSNKITGTVIHKDAVMSEVTKPKTLSPKKIIEILKACGGTKALGTVLYNRLEKREKELAELREWKADVEDSHKRVMSEQCPTDEQHCTCVPILRAELAEALEWKKLSACAVCAENPSVAEFVKNKEDELAEAKEALASWQNEALQSRATINLLTESTKELSALQAQIEAGELVPADVAVQWALEIPFGGMTLPAYVKYLTAEKAGSN